MKTRLLIHPKANYALKEGMGHLYKINKLNIICLLSYDFSFTIVASNSVARQDKDPAY